MSPHVLGLDHHVVLLLGFPVHVGKGCSDDTWTGEWETSHIFIDNNIKTKKVLGKGKQRKKTEPALTEESLQHDNYNTK